MAVTVPFCGKEHEQPYDFYRFTSYGIRNTLESAGFKIERLTKSGSYRDCIRSLKINDCSDRYHSSCKIKKLFYGFRLALACPCSNIASLLDKNSKSGKNPLFINSFIIAGKSEDDRSSG